MIALNAKTRAKDLKVDCFNFVSSQIFAHLAKRGSMRTVIVYQTYQELTPKYKNKSISNSSQVPNCYWR